MARNPILTMSQWEARVRSVYSSIVIYKMTSDRANEYIDKHIRDELNRTHGVIRPKSVYSTYIHGFVQGLQTAERDLLYRKFLEYCYLYEGKLYSTHKESLHPTTEFFYSRNMGHVLADCPSGYYWRGSDKPYYVSTDKKEVVQ